MRNKILFIFSLPPPTHGSNIVNQYISTFDYKDIADIDIFSLRYADSIAGIGVYNCKKFLLIIKYIIELNKRLRSFKPDFAYFVPSVTGLPFLRDCIYVLCLKIYGVKRIVHLHGKGINEKTKNLFLKYLYKWFFKNSKIIHLSKRLIYDLEGIANTRDIFILPNGTESLFQESICDEENVKKNNEKLNLLYFSNFIKSKGIHDFLKACSLLNKQNYEFNILLIGNYTKIFSKTYLFKLINNLNLHDHILHIGPAFGLEKKRLLSIADILIFPTFYDKECFPLVILEAMSLKIPIISTNEGAIEEIIDHNKSGFIVEKRDVISIASKIKTLMENPKLRYSMAKNAYEKYKDNYTLDIFESNYKSLIKYIINDERIVMGSGKRYF